MKMGIGKGLLERETEAKLLAAEPSLEKEVSDHLMASTIYFKFVVFKTPTLLDSSVRIPKKMLIKFKFFTFAEDTSCLILPKEVTSDGSKSLVKSWASGTQYKLERISRNKKEIGEEEAWTYKKIFHVDPSTSSIKDEHIELASYLKERVLSIEIFDADSVMHFGTAKIPL